MQPAVPTVSLAPLDLTTDISRVVAQVWVGWIHTDVYDGLQPATSWMTWTAYKAAPVKYFKQYRSAPSCRVIVIYNPGQLDHKVVVRTLRARYAAQALDQDPGLLDFIQHEDVEGGDTPLEGELAVVAAEPPDETACE